MARNIRTVLKVYGLLRSLTDDETALLETLRAFTDSEREAFVEALAPAKPTQPASKPLERCTHVYESGTVCGGAKRNIVHHNPNHVDYHEFTTKKPAKSSRASSIEGRLSKSTPPALTARDDNYAAQAQEPLCTICNHPESYEDHEQPSPHYHAFVPPIVRRVRPVEVNPLGEVGEVAQKVSAGD